MATYQHRRSDISKKNLTRFFQYLVLSIVTLIIVVPIMILFFDSLKTTGEMFMHPYTIPNPPHWENYGQILFSPTFWVLMRNSLVVMVSATAGVLIVCSLAAFVFARIQFRGKDLAFNFLTLGLMFPITVAILPVYLVIRQMHLTNTLIAVISGANCIWNIWEYLDFARIFSGGPSRVAGCRLHRWMYFIWLLLAHTAAARTPGASSGRGIDHDRQLE